MAIQVTQIYSSTDLFIAHFFFDAAADTAGAIPHNMLGLVATAITAGAAANPGGTISLVLLPIVGAGAPPVATLYYLEQLFVVSVTVANINIGRTQPNGPAVANNARVELRRVHHYHR